MTSEKDYVDISILILQPMPNQIATNMYVSPSRIATNNNLHVSALFLASNNRAKTVR